MDEYTAPSYLRTFFAEERLGRTRSRQDRYERVHEHLLHFLDQGDTSASLGTHPASLVEAERQVTPKGAFLRVFGFEELICCIPEFLSEAWLLPTPADARAQISLMDRLLRWLRRYRLFDQQLAICAYWDAEAAVKRARRRGHDSSDDLLGAPSEPFPPLRLVRNLEEAHHEA